MRRREGAARAAARAGGRAPQHLVGWRVERARGGGGGGGVEAVQAGPKTAPDGGRAKRARGRSVCEHARASTTAIPGGGRAVLARVARVRVGGPCAGATPRAVTPPPTYPELASAPAVDLLLEPQRSFCLLYSGEPLIT